MSKCKYEKEEHCTLNECMYGDFLFIDDSAFESGKYCLCDDVKKYKEQKMSCCKICNSWKGQSNDSR